MPSSFYVCAVLFSRSADAYVRISFGYHRTLTCEQRMNYVTQNVVDTLVPYALCDIFRVTCYAIS